MRRSLPPLVGLHRVARAAGGRGPAVLPAAHHQEGDNQDQHGASGHGQDRIAIMRAGLRHGTAPGLEWMSVKVSGEERVGSLVTRCALRH